MIRTREWTPDEIAAAYERAEDRRLAQAEAPKCGEDLREPEEPYYDDDLADRAAADWYQWRMG